MPDSATKDCPQREAARKLAGEELPDDRRVIVQRHLEQCEPCRAAFRKLTADRFPRLRSYTVIARIGAGAFGEVFKVIHHVKQRSEALKLLYTETRFRTASFENEVHAIARLRHPNIATLFDANLAAPPLYYTMELVEGRQLDEHFRSPDISLAERIEIFRKVALAMDYAHRQGVVHRDLKPQNILIDTAGQPRIVDFGIARKLALADDEGAVPAEPVRIGDGTYAYIAPEEKAGRAADGRADIYALGVMLHQAVTGSAEVSDERPGDPIEALRQRKISRPADLSAIIVRCLQEDPARRYSTCAKLAEDLAAYSALRPVAAHVEPSAGYEVTRAAGLALRRHPIAVLVVLIAVAACGLAGLFSAAHARRLEAGFGGPTTTVIQFRPSTIEAIRAARIGGDLPGLSASIPKSWRLLHGELMRILAEAGPRAVVWDYFVPDCYPEYDQALLRGFDALTAAGIPIVIGARSFDVNGKPLGCPEVLAAAHSIGALHAAHPGSLAGEFVVPICIRHGLSPPVPSLSIAGFAAARFPDSILDLRPEGQRVIVCYRRRHFEPGQREWRTETDAFDVAHAGRDELSGFLYPGAEIFYARVNKTAPAEQDGQVVGLEDVLTASPEQLRSRFGGRVVLIGPALPGTDEYATTDGKTIFGHQVQARALDSFLGQARPVPIPFFWLLLRTLSWSLMAALAIRIIPAGNGVSIRRSAPLCLASCTVGLAVGLLCTAYLSSPWMVEAAIGTCTVLVAGGLTYLVRAGR